MNNTKMNKIRRRRPRPLLYVSPIHKATRQTAIYIAERVAELDISAPEAHILAYLQAYGPCPVGELVRVFGYKKPTMTGMLDRLAERGYVVRRINPDDRRSFLVGTTASGDKIANEARVPVERLDRDIAKRVTERDLAGFQRVMRAIAVITGVNVRGGGDDHTE